MVFVGSFDPDKKDERYRRLEKLVEDSIRATKDRRIGDGRRSLEERHERARKLRQSDKGKYRVLWVDKFDGSDGIEGEYKTAEEALKVARQKTKEAMKSTTGYGVATMYYAYDPNGRYLGGDVWVGE